MSGTSFYPDANPEATSVDGRTYRFFSVGNGGTWSSIHDGTGIGATDDANYLYEIVLQSDSGTGNWRQIDRGNLLFNTSALGPTAVVSEGTITLYGYQKSDDLVCTPNINIYSCITGSNTALAAADYLYTNYGTVAFSTAITYSAYQVSAVAAVVNNFVLNAAGIANINVTGISPFSIRNANYDVANTAPAWKNNVASTIYSYAAEKGSGYKPTLTVTYTIPSGVTVIRGWMSK